MYDTRVFTTIYSDIATHLVNDQRRRDVEVSRVAARSALSRSFVDFFERDVPVVIRSLYSLVGAIVFLCFLDWALAPMCIALLIPCWILNRHYSRKAHVLNRGLHDELEREVEVIDQSPEREQGVNNHYRGAARWRVRLSDLEATNFGLMELFVLALIAGALVRFCAGSPQPGDVFAVVRYLLMFIMALDSVPLLVQKFSKLRDIGRRIGDSTAGEKGS